MFKRHRGLILFVIALVIAFLVFYALRSALLPFVMGLAMAYILVPPISWLEQKLPRPNRWRNTKRITIILVFFLVILTIASVLAFYFVNAIINAFTLLGQNAPTYLSSALYSIEQWTSDLRAQFPPEIQIQITDFFREAATTLGNTIKGNLVKGISFIPNTFGLIFGFAALPLFLFYLLKDTERLKRGFYAAFSPWVAEHLKNLVSIIEEVLGRYMRAQLVLGAIVTYLTFFGLWFIGIRGFAAALSLFAGVTELIPTIGPWIGGAVAVIITLAVAPEKVVWVIILYLVVQLLENSLLVPRIQGGYLHMHPAMVILLLVLGAYVAGFWGLILAVPLTATAVEIYKYIHQNVEAENTRESLLNNQD
ncbi:MAG: AI-2E family transporter [Dehalococcoidales bacterium]